MKQLFPAAALFLASVAAFPAAAQQPSEAQKDKAPVTITGCLMAGESENQFKMSDAEGQAYDLMGSTVNLKPHVGHQVAITGTLDDKATDGHASSDRKLQSLQVADLKMISTTCK